MPDTSQAKKTPPEPILSECGPSYEVSHPAKIPYHWPSATLASKTAWLKVAPAVVSVAQSGVTQSIRSPWRGGIWFKGRKTRAAMAWSDANLGTTYLSTITVSVRGSTITLRHRNPPWLNRVRPPSPEMIARPEDRSTWRILPNKFGGGWAQERQGSIGRVLPIKFERWWEWRGEDWGEMSG